MLVLSVVSVVVRPIAHYEYSVPRVTRDEVTINKPKADGYRGRERRIYEHKNAVKPRDPLLNYKAGSQLCMGENANTRFVCDVIPANAGCTCLTSMTLTKWTLVRPEQSRLRHTKARSGVRREA